VTKPAFCSRCGWSGRTDRNPSPCPDCGHSATQSAFDGVAALRAARDLSAKATAAAWTLARALSPVAPWTGQPVLNEVWLTVAEGKATAEVWTGAHQVGLMISPPSGVGCYRVVMGPDQVEDFRAWLKMRAKGGRGAIGKHRQYMARKLCDALGWEV
jgi:hypothetical protein